jgi:hypothetical protein
MPANPRSFRLLRIFFTGLLLLFGGAVVTLAVAWGLSPLEQSVVSAAPVVAERVWPHDPPIGWPTHAARFERGHGSIHDHDLWTADLLINAAGNQTNRSMFEIRAGVPFRCFASWGTKVERSGTRSVIARHGISEGTIPILGWSGLPLIPIWPGLALDSTFYAAIAWSLWQIPLALRRRSRRNANKCVTCGYGRLGLATNAVCPECGKLPS